MNGSGIFESLGMGSLDIAILFFILFGLILILFIILIVMLVKQHNLKKKYEAFMKGKDAGSMETEIMDLFNIIDKLRAVANTHSKEIRRIYRRLESVYQKLGIVKYDAFNQMGGQLSFSLALLDEKNNGFIINSVHSSDGCYSYTKEITEGTCAGTLGEEEKEALAIAMGQTEVEEK